MSVSQLLLSLVSALCNVSERVGSQRYTTVNLKMTNCCRPGICICNSGVSLRNCGEVRQITQNAYFYILLFQVCSHVGIRLHVWRVVFSLVWLEAHTHTHTHTHLFHSMLQSASYEDCAQTGQLSANHINSLTRSENRWNSATNLQ